MADEANSHSCVGFKNTIGHLQHHCDSLPAPLSSETVSLSAPKPKEEGTTKNPNSRPRKESSSKPKSPLGNELGGSQELGKELLAMSLRNPAQPGRRSDAGKERSLEIQVVDETALIGAVFSKKSAARGGQRRSAPPAPVPVMKARTTKSAYTREEMEALRFSNAAEQRRMWDDIHVGLGPAVRKEYDFLLVSKDVHYSFDPSRRFLNKDQSPPLFDASDAATRGRWNNEVKVSAN